jgi:hypothetical protein
VVLSFVLPVHQVGPVAQRGGQLGGVADAECEVEVRPPVLCISGGGPGHGCAGDARVGLRGGDQRGAQALAILFCVDRRAQ